MEVRSFTGGLALGLIVAGGVWVSKRMDDQISSGPDRSWALPRYDYQEWPYDDPQTIFVTGTLVGKGVGYPVNTWKLTCSREDHKCEGASAQEIGRDQLGEIDTDEWPISTWNEHVVVATSEDTTACARATITVNRDAKSVLYTSLPQNTNKDYCKRIHDPQTYEWHISNPEEPWEKKST